MTDTEGRKILDCLSCAGALPLGHSHPEIQKVLIDFLQSRRLHQALDLATPVKFEFTQKLFSVLPSKFADNARILFCGPTGADAVEAAMKLTRHATKRYPIIAFRGAYHGMTGGALAAMGNLNPKAAGNAAFGGIHFAPYPYQYRCPFGTDGSRTDELSLAYLDTLLTDPEGGVVKPAAVILEVVQGEGGCIPASDTWLRGVRDITKRLDIPLVIDEVQTGIGRTGHMFAFQRAGIEPDVLILSKAVGGGFPLAVLVYKEELDKLSRGMHAGTFRGNQIAMLAGRVVMEVIQRDRLVENAQSVGDQLLKDLRQLSERYPILGDVRGRGLMIGVEVIKPVHRDQKGAHDGEMAKRIKMAVFEKGLLIETGGRHDSVLRLLPPLVLSASEAGAAIDRLDSALKQIAA